MPRDHVKRVLIVEDDPHQQAIYSALLHHNGYEVETAGSVTEALSVAKSTTPDVILMDVILPDGNGLNVVRSIRGLPGLSDVAVVCMSSYVINYKRMAEAGCDGLIHKPLTGPDLVEAIESVARQD